MSRYNELSRLVEALVTELEALRQESDRDPVPVRDIGGLVKARRREQKLTQAELADLAGIGAATLKRIESGNQDVTFSNLSRVLDALGIRLWIG